jgi:hypothetical protein
LLSLIEKDRVPLVLPPPTTWPLFNASSTLLHFLSADVTHSHTHTQSFTHVDNITKHNMSEHTHPIPISLIPPSLPPSLIIALSLPFSATLPSLALFPFQISNGIIILRGRKQISQGWREIQESSFPGRFSSAL